MTAAMILCCLAALFTSATCLTLKHSPSKRKSGSGARVQRLTSVDGETSSGGGLGGGLVLNRQTSTHGDEHGATGARPDLLPTNVDSKRTRQKDSGDQSRIPNSSPALDTGQNNPDAVDPSDVVLEERLDVDIVEQTHL